MSYPGELKKKAYEIYSTLRMKGIESFSLRKVALHLQNYLKENPKMFPMIKPSTISHKTIANWEQKYNWLNLTGDQVKEEVKKDDKVVYLEPDEVRRPKPKKKPPKQIQSKPIKKSNTKTKDKKEKIVHLNKQYLVDDLKKNRVSQMRLREGILYRMEEICEAISIREDGYVQNSENIFLLGSLSTALKNINRDLEYSDELLGVAEMIEKETTQEMKEGEMVTKVLSLSPEKRDYLVSFYPVLLKHPEIKKLYPDGIPVKQAGE